MNPTPTKEKKMTKQIQMQPVESSNLTAIGYDAERKILAVKFKNGTVYNYSDVPEKTFEELRSSESIGKFFHSRIKNIFKYLKI